MTNTFGIFYYVAGRDDLSTELAGVLPDKQRPDSCEPIEDLPAVFLEGKLAANMNVEREKDIFSYLLFVFI